LIAIVTRDVPPDLVRLHGLVEQRAGVEVAQLAHRLAGSVASLGAVSLRAALHELEQAGRKADWAAADRIRATLEQDWTATRDALQKFSAQPPR
jgi:HPt (histidine-containing phosphotransfer) domain-containing protein